MKSVVVCIFALLIVAGWGAQAQAYDLPPHARALLALSVFDVCNGSTQEVSNTLAQTLVSGSGSLAAADARVGTTCLL